MPDDYDRAWNKAFRGAFLALAIVGLGVTFAGLERSGVPFLAGVPVAVIGFIGWTRYLD